MSNCPYDGSADFTVVVSPTRPRPGTHTLVQCDSCLGYYIRHENGTNKPLNDRTDPEGDMIARVIDG